MRKYGVTQNLLCHKNGITKGGINMKKRFFFVSLFLLSFLLNSCVFSITPQLERIKFTDDKTIEYEFPLVKEDEEYQTYFVKKFYSDRKNKYFFQ